jgi:hypothetical protein
MTLIKFNSGDKVRFKNIGSDILEGQTGEVVGVSVDHPETTHFIIQLDVPVQSEFPMFSGDIKAVQITEHCLEKI